MKVCRLLFLVFNCVHTHSIFCIFSHFLSPYDIILVACDCMSCSAIQHVPLPTPSSFVHYISYRRRSSVRPECNSWYFPKVVFSSIIIQVSCLFVRHLITNLINMNPHPDTFSINDLTSDVIAFVCE